MSENKNELLGIISDSKFFLKITQATSVRKQVENSTHLQELLDMCHEKKKDSYESICNISIWVLFFSLDVL